LRWIRFHAGDAGHVPRAMGHYSENTGNEAIRHLELLNSAYNADMSRTNWMAHSPHDLVAQHLHISQDLRDKLPMQKLGVVPTLIFGCPDCFVAVAPPIDAWATTIWARPAHGRASVARARHLSICRALGTGGEADCKGLLRRLLHRS
jgi:hypothetical protein